MGMVNLPFIYAVVKSKQAHNDKPTFMISVTMYLNSKGEEKGKRDLYFSCATEEQRDKWMIAIDYLKTLRCVCLEKHSRQLYEPTS